MLLTSTPHLASHWLRWYGTSRQQTDTKDSQVTASSPAGAGRRAYGRAGSVSKGGAGGGRSGARSRAPPGTR